MLHAWACPRRLHFPTQLKTGAARVLYRVRRRMERRAADQDKAPAAAQAAAVKGPVRLAVVGDVHGYWDADSEAALASLGADVAVFVGDFGEEDTELVGCIAALRHRKAVVLGNHEAWYSLTERGRARLARKLAQPNSAAAALAAAVEAAPSVGREGLQRAAAGGTAASAAVARQLELLGPDHVGFGATHYEDLGLSIVGGRPFSKGGKQWSDVAAFYRELYGVSSPAESAQRIVEVAAGLPAGSCSVLVAHNGPSGLGSRRLDICGVDWTQEEGDHGDPDLQAALRTLHSRGIPMPLVLFGHMHSGLKGGGQRNMAHVDLTTGTVFVNCAVVPRIREFQLAVGAGLLAEGLQIAASNGGPSQSNQSGVGGPGWPTESSGESSDDPVACTQQGQLQRQQSQPCGECECEAGGTQAATRTFGGAAWDSASGTDSPAAADDTKETRPAPRGGLLQGRAHHFLVVETSPEGLVFAKNVWVGVAGASSEAMGGGQRCFVLSEEGLVSLRHRDAEGSVYAVFKGHEKKWETVHCSSTTAAARSM